MIINEEQVNKTSNVAIIHDFSWGMRGAERCVDALCELFPDADLYMMFGDRSKLSSTICKHKIYFSFLQAIPWLKKFYRYTYFLWPIAIESFDLSDYDLIISSSSVVAKGVITPPWSVHISYMYTPMRYAWGQMHTYFSPHLGHFSWWKRLFIYPFLNYLRIWDVASTARVDKIIAISELSKQRIKKYYKREVEKVIFPPVKMLPKIKKEYNRSLFTLVPMNERENYYVAIAPFEPNKAGKLLLGVVHSLGLHLKIIGEGSMKKDMMRVSQRMKDGRMERNENWSDGSSRTIPGKIEFLGWVSEQEKFDLLSNAQGCIFCGVEEFGIAAVESLMCGTPVVTYQDSGVAEIVLDGKTGVVFDAQTIENVGDALERLEKGVVDGNIKAKNIAKAARKFSKERFKEEFMEVVLASTAIK